MQSMKNSRMNTYELNKILRRNDVTAPFYLGCFAADRIPANISTYPCCMVVNTDDSASAGTHWVCMYLASAAVVDYFDSLAVWPSSSAHIDAYLRRFTHVHTAPCAVQSDRSMACGKHVIYFLHRRCRGWPMDRIVWHLVQCKSGPDRLVNEFVRKFIFDDKL